jgi:glycerophosphoryl diester phosphodiesterase
MTLLLAFRLLWAMRRTLATIVFCCAPVLTAAAFDLQGHRGARGLAPENTIEGFVAALAVGVDTLELDLGMTRDGVVVVHHDIWLNPDTTRDPDGDFLQARGPALRALTLAELKRYDVGRLKPGTRYAQTFSEQRAVDGARVPTLAEVFDLVRRAGATHVRLNVETKLTPASGAEAADPETFAASVPRSCARRTSQSASRCSRSTGGPWRRYGGSPRRSHASA